MVDQGWENLSKGNMMLLHRRLLVLQSAEQPE
jgi:hypothetical protein